jgi:hypothetical protein
LMKKLFGIQICIFFLNQILIRKLDKTIFDKAVINVINGHIFR